MSTLDISKCGMHVALGYRLDMHVEKRLCLISTNVKIRIYLLEFNDFLMVYS